MSHLATTADDFAITPSEIRKAPWVPFTFTCRAPIGLRPNLVFDGNEKHLSEDKRFSIARPSENEIVASAPYGLPGKSTLKIW